MNYYKKMTRKILLAITIASALIFTNVGMPLSSFQITTVMAKQKASAKKEKSRPPFEVGFDFVLQAWEH